MDRIEILLPEAIFAPTRRLLEAAFTVHALHEAADPDALLAEAGPRIRAIARGNHRLIDRALMAKLPGLEIVAVFGAGYDGIDLDYARERGIVVTHTPGVLDEEVADYAIGLMVMTIREFPAAMRYLRDGTWKAKGPFPQVANSLRDRTVGIVGLGRIGRAIARRLEAMQVPVVYHARHRRADAPYRYFADLLALAEAVDTLVIAVPGGEATRGLIDADVLKALGPRGMVFNIGRGSSIDEKALIAALESRRIAGAGLDVYASEPDIDPAFLALDNVVLLPHAGSATVQTHGAMGQLLVDNLKNWFEHKQPLTPVPESS
jgi:lactate dehydrogenase-like 2-hydroxyacid dehydrogenase